MDSYVPTTGRTGDVRLRPYQQAAVDGVEERVRAGIKRILIVAPTGSGKTTMAAALITRALARRERVLFMAHRRELIGQAYQRLLDVGVSERELGVLMASDPRSRIGARVQVASVDTLRNRAKPRADLVFVDECLPAGTLVDGRPIESLRTGDTVESFDPTTGRVELRRITHTFVSRPRALVTVCLADGRRLTCTPSHPIYTPAGYVPAGSLRPQDLVARSRGTDGRDRGRRIQPQLASAPGAGREEGGALELARVDRVEVHERGSDGRFGGLCPDGRVYNLEVDGHHNFFANGILTHNCHRATAKSYRDIAKHYPDAVHLGLTATPFRADGSGLGDAYDDLLVVASPRELIGEGHLVEPRVFTVPKDALPDLSSVRVTAGDYNQRGLAEAVDSTQLVGNLVDHWMRHAEGVRTVAFAVSVAHSQHIAEQFRQAGVPAEHLDGETPAEERDAILARLDSGETRVVSNCGVLCLDEATEILTAEGWASIDRMTPERRVVSWRDGVVAFEKPLAIHRRGLLDGERMVRLASQTADLRVTEGHGIVYRTSSRSPWQKAPARELVGRAVTLPAWGAAAADVYPPSVGPHSARGAWSAGVRVRAPHKAQLDFVQAVAAARGYRTRLRPPHNGLWSLTLSFGRHHTPDRARLTFDAPRPGERVWCVTTEAGNIVTRRNGKVVVLGNCEGWDQPAVKCAILARPTKSAGLYLQQAGRILRPWNGQRAIILDHGGCALAHGLPQDDRVFSLEGTKKKRGGGPSMAPVRTCPECNAVLPATTRTCPECGAVLQSRPAVPVVQDGALVEINSADARRIELDRLRAIAKARGYKPGWVYKRYCEKHGEPPPRDLAPRPIESLRPGSAMRAVRDLLQSGKSVTWDALDDALGLRTEAP